jgi:ribosomal protein S18 acetylase RimI-like enzyme
MASVSELHANDIPQLRKFIMEAWRQAGTAALGWTGATDENIDAIASEDFLRGLVENSDLKIFINKTRKEVSGFCALRKMDAKSVELAGIIVRQDRFGQGIGSALFARAKTEARKSGFNTMVVKTEALNDRALRFYKGKGFTEQNRVVEELKGKKVSLIVLKREL